MGLVEQFDNKKYMQDNILLQVNEVNEYQTLPLTFATSLKHKFGKHHSNKTGLSINYSTHDWDIIKRNNASGQLDTLVQGNGNSITGQIFTSSNFSLSERWTVNAGVHGLFYSVNEAYSIQPRIGIQYLINEKNKIAIAYGRHSQTDHYATYLYRETNENGDRTYPNADLGLIMANHFIASYKSNVFKNHQVSLEAYYQTLTNVPVEAGGTFSTINLNELDQIRPLVNNGSGTNYGVDFGIQRFAENGLYYMLNSSLIRSLYVAGDAIERSTEYDLGYTTKFLLGKEYEIGKAKHNYLGWNTNLSVIGGQPYTPINIDQSRLAQETVLDEPLAYSQRDNPLVFLDLTITYKTNKKKEARCGQYSSKISLRMVMPFIANMMRCWIRK